MEFFDVIEKRYSMRGFEDKEVEKEKLEYDFFSLLQANIRIF